MALSIASDGKPLKGVGEVPSWLTDENAKALESAPCMKGMLLDKACRFCKPAPKPTRETNDALAAKAAEMEAKTEGAAKTQAAAIEQTTTEPGTSEQTTTEPEK